MDRGICIPISLLREVLDLAVFSIITFDVNHAVRYVFYMIVSFKSADTEALAGGRRVKRFVNIDSVARRKLRQLEIAVRLEDLRVPPGNRLEAIAQDSTVSA